MSILLTFLIYLQLSASSDSNAFSEGIRFYREKDYVRAAEEFEKAASVSSNHNIEFNLGNAFFKQGKTGKAILHYERSLRIRYSPDAEKNLDFAVSATKDRIQFDKNIFEKFLFRLDTALFAYFGVFLLFLSSMGFSLKIWKKGFPVWICLALLFLSLPLLAVSWASHLHKSDEKGVLISQSAEVRVAPAHDEAVSFRINEGSRFLIEENRGKWCRISLPNSISGWILSDLIEKI